MTKFFLFIILSVLLPVLDSAHAVIFGAEIFRRSTTQFQPLQNGPAPPNYRIGPGDVLVLVISGDIEFVHNLEVTREGFVIIPQVGQVFTTGMTL